MRPSWINGYTRETLAQDAVAALVVTVMLIPQSLAYAMLAGVPPEMGLYASILPLVAYSLVGSSRTLSVGPVAVISLMTAASVRDAVATTGVNYLEATVALALLSGAILILMGALRLGVFTNLLSQPVVAGFITASSIIIIFSQLQHMTGVSAVGDNALLLARQLIQSAGETHFATLIVGVVVIAFLLWARSNLARVFQGFHIRPGLAVSLSRAAPIIAVIVAIAASGLIGLEARGVAVVGEVPSGLPSLSIPMMNLDLWRQLLVPALLLSLIGYVESVSVGKTLAAKRRQSIEPNRELFGLGAANVASALSSGIPVTGGFSRSAVNFEAGAQTQVASLLAAVGIAVAAVFLTPYLSLLPKAVLAATIIVAIIPLIDLRTPGLAWRYSKTDFVAISGTIVFTLLLGVEIGLVFGVVSSIVLHLYKTSRPHIAIVGAVPGTEHFRNVDRHEVVTSPRILTLRVDESLYFANAAYVENRIYGELSANTRIEHVVLMCPAINEIDLSALETLESLNETLKEQGIKFHMSEVKGPVMDCLGKTNFLDNMTGNVYLSQYRAMLDLDPGATGHLTAQTTIHASNEEVEP